MVIALGIGTQLPDVSGQSCAFDWIMRHCFPRQPARAMKIVIVVLLILVVVSLFSGLVFMYRDKGQSKRTVIALTIRVSLSLLIFAIVVAAHFLGWLPGK
jgi:hypothetical protein